MPMTILPIAYWGDIEYFARLVRGGGECVIDIREHYIKRSLRNRTEIMTANGTMPLSVCLQHADRPRTPVCDVRIDYSKRWQHQHWISLVSAYRRTPYFDYFAEYFHPFYERETKYLVDLNNGLHEVIMQLFSRSMQPIEGYRLMPTTDWGGEDLEHWFGDGRSVLDELFDGREWQEI